MRTTGARRRQGRVAVLFLLPLAVFYGAFYLYSFYFVLSTSLLKTDSSLQHPVFVGLQNYALLLQHDKFHVAIFNTLAFAAVAIVAALTLGFFLAVVLATKPRGAHFFYAVFLLPSLMPMSLVASVFAIMLESRFGMVNSVLRAVGMDGLAQRWMSDPSLAWFSVATIFVYIIGLPIMYYTADLAAMNVSLLEAAVVDGAGPFQMFRLILFPILSGARRVIIMSILLGSFRAFEIVFLSTGGGPSGRTEIVGTYLYNFSTSGLDVGYVSAAAVIVLAIALGISGVHLAWQKRAHRGSVA